MRAVASKCCNLLIYLYFIFLLHYAPSQGELKSLLLDNLNTDPKWNGLEAALIVDEAERNRGNASWRWASVGSDTIKESIFADKMTHFFKKHQKGFLYEP